MMGRWIWAAALLVRVEASYWLENIKPQGFAPYNSDPSYSTFRNVKSYGAVGDGIHDDTAAITLAISSGNRCGPQCNSSTTSPALVYIPSGKYLISSAVPLYYWTQLTGDYNSKPTLVAAANFTGVAVLDANPRNSDGQNWFAPATNNFFRGVRNLVIDLTNTPSATGLHWQVSQATSLINVDFVMSTDTAKTQQGIFIEEGSGGIMGDLTFTGGRYGISIGNQQFTLRNLTFRNVQTAINQIWGWSLTAIDITIQDCGIGLTFPSGSNSSLQMSNSITAVDWRATNTPILFQLANASAGSLVLDNVITANVPVLVSGEGSTILEGSSGQITTQSWIQGQTYTNGKFANIRGPSPVNRPSGLVGTDNRFFGQSQPQYGDALDSTIVSVKDHGVLGDGKTDDADVLQSVLNDFASGSIIYVPNGMYMLSKTLTLPSGTRMVGEAWPWFIGYGDNFTDSASPQPVVRLGADSSSGSIAISDVIFSTKGPAAGAVVVQVNMKAEEQGSVALFNSHIVLGGFTGSDLSYPACTSNQSYPGGDKCRSAFLGMHVQKGASIYLDGTWIWNADHDLDAGANQQLSLFSGRGFLSESSEPAFLYGSASEHHVLYQYNLFDAANMLLVLPQTETPYYEGINYPLPTGIQPPNTVFNDPTFSNCNTSDVNCNRALALTVTGSSDLLVYTTGFYSFFSNYTQNCVGPNVSSCQTDLLAIQDSSKISIFNLNTIGNVVMANLDGVPAVLQVQVNQTGIDSVLAVFAT